MCEEKYELLGWWIWWKLLFGFVIDADEYNEIQTKFFVGTKTE